jgi:hypothetical protein
MMSDVHRRRDTEAGCARGWKTSVHDLLQDIQDMRYDFASARKSAGTYAVEASFRRIATCKALEEVAVASGVTASTRATHGSTVLNVSNDRKNSAWKENTLVMNDRTRGSLVMNDRTSGALHGDMVDGDGVYSAWGGNMVMNDRTSIDTAKDNIYAHHKDGAHAKNNLRTSAPGFNASPLLEGMTRSLTTSSHTRRQTDGYLDRQTDEGVRTQAAKHGSFAQNLLQGKVGNFNHNKSTDSVKGTRLEETLRLVRLAHSDDDRAHLEDASRRSRSAVSTPTSNLAKSVLSNWMARAVEDSDDDDDDDDDGNVPQINSESKSAVVSAKPSFALDSDYVQSESSRIHTLQNSAKSRVLDSDYVKYRMPDSDSDYRGGHGTKWTGTDRQTDDYRVNMHHALPPSTSVAFERKREQPEIHSQDRANGESSRGSAYHASDHRSEEPLLQDKLPCLDHAQV